MAVSQDTEITLGTGRLLGLFFGLVVVCALFFGFGYTLGRGTAKQSGSIVNQPDGTSVIATTEKKPVASASNGAPASAKPSDCTANGSDCTASSPQDSSSQDLSFYKSVEQKDAPTQLEKPQQPAPEMKGAVPSNSAPGAGFMVQVAAVSKQEDADLLRSALQGKQYPVVVTSMTSDKLFHVQVGPFADMKDAEAIKSRLMSDGYNPIVKK